MEKVDRVEKMDKVDKDKVDKDKGIRPGAVRVAVRTRILEPNRPPNFK